MATSYKVNKKSLLKEFPYISKNRMETILKHNEYKTERGLRNHLTKVNACYENRANQKDVLRMTIKINWKRNRKYGNNDPHASYYLTYQDGTEDYSSGYSCNGGGYDKESTVVLNIFNVVFSGMLWRKRNSRKEKPYGVYCEKKSFPHFGWGIGMSSVEDIVEWLGGKMKHTAWTDDFDQYDINFPKRKAAKL